MCNKDISRTDKYMIVGSIAFIVLSLAIFGGVLGYLLSRPEEAGGTNSTDSTTPEETLTTTLTPQIDDSKTYPGDDAGQEFQTFNYTLANDNYSCEMKADKNTNATTCLPFMQAIITFKRVHYQGIFDGLWKYINASNATFQEANGTFKIYPDKIYSNYSFKVVDLPIFVNSTYLFELFTCKAVDVPLKNLLNDTTCSELAADTFCYFVKKNLQREAVMLGLKEADLVNSEEKWLRKSDSNSSTITITGSGSFLFTLNTNATIIETLEELKNTTLQFDHDLTETCQCLFWKEHLDKNKGNKNGNNTATCLKKNNVREEFREVLMPDLPCDGKNEMKGAKKVN